MHIYVDLFIYLLFIYLFNYLFIYLFVYIYGATSIYFWSLRNALNPLGHPPKKRMRLGYSWTELVWFHTSTNTKSALVEAIFNNLIVELSSDNQNIHSHGFVSQEKNKVPGGSPINP